MTTYVRFSDDDYHSDVHVYSADGQWVTLVARGRYIPLEEMPPRVPVPDDPTPQALDRFARLVLDRERQVRHILESGLLADIEGPYDGQMLLDTTPGACADRLEMLRSCGYRVPQRPIGELRSQDRERTGA